MVTAGSEEVTELHGGCTGMVNACHDWLIAECVESKDG